MEFVERSKKIQKKKKRDLIEKIKKVSLITFS